MSYLEIIAVAFIAWLILVTLFTPAIPLHAEGAPNADFSRWTAMGNVAFDVHGYFGGRWGGGRPVRACR